MNTKGDVFLDQYFKLYGNCILVKGFRSAIICDLQRGRILALSRKLSPLLEDSRSLRQILLSQNSTFERDIIFFFNRLCDEGFGHFTDDPDLFPAISLEWHSPFDLTHAIIEVCDKMLSGISSIIMELVRLNCRVFEFRFVDDCPIDKINNLLHLIKKFDINSVYIYCPYSEELYSGSFEIIKTNLKIMLLFLYSAPVCKVYNLDSGELRLHVADCTNLKVCGTCVQNDKKVTW